MYVEIDERVIRSTKRLAGRLDLPVNRVVELALKEMIKNDPQLELKFPNADTSKLRKSR